MSPPGRISSISTLAVNYVYAAEIFPTVVRTAGLGSSSFWARVGPMVGDDYVICWLILSYLFVDCTLHCWTQNIRRSNSSGCVWNCSIVFCIFGINVLFWNFIIFLLFRWPSCQRRPRLLSQTLLRMENILGVGTASGTSAGHQTQRNVRQKKRFVCKYILFFMGCNEWILFEWNYIKVCFTSSWHW